MLVVKGLVAVAASVLAWLGLRYRKRVARFELERSQRAADEFPLLSFFRMAPESARRAIAFRLAVGFVALSLILFAAWAAFIAGIVERVQGAPPGPTHPPAAPGHGRLWFLIALAVLFWVQAGILVHMRHRLARYLVKLWAASGEASADVENPTWRRAAGLWATLTIVVAAALGAGALLLALRPP